MARNDQLSELMLRRKGKVLIDRIEDSKVDILNTNDRNGYM